MSLQERPPMSLYEDLGVPRDADPAAIKRAYRKRARDTHPDVGGDRKAFERVSRANLILSDPARRAKYDRTGEADDSPDNTESRALSALVGFFAAVVEQHLQGAPDPFFLDLIKAARESFTEMLKNHEKQQKRLERGRSLTEKLESRLQGNPLLKAALKARALSFAEPLGKVQQEVEQCKEVLRLLEGCTFTVDSQVFTWQIMPTNSTT